MASDPALDLKAAGRDGLLTYHGFVSPDGYEVAVGGRKMVVPSDEVASLVARVRAVEGVGCSLGVSAGVIELRGDGTHVVRIGSLPQEVELPADEVVDWCAGFVAAHEAREQVHVGEDTIGRIAELFERPSLNDQCRMVVLGLMYGRGAAEKVTAVQLTEKIGELPWVAKRPAKKTVVDALGFGSYLAERLREQMIAVFGLRWGDVFGPLYPVSADEQARPAAVEVPDPLPEMPTLAVLRRIVSASRRGWLRYLDKASPNDARWNRRFRVSVGERVYELRVEQFGAWLDGLAFYHGN